MATSVLLRLSFLMCLLAITTARPGRPFHPCQTLIFFSTSSSRTSTFSSPRSITVFFTEIRPANPMITFDPIPTRIESQIEPQEDDQQFPLGLYSSVSASFRDRTKDILRVVGSLLFGVGCGALTAATLFLVWSLFAPDRFRYQDESEDEFGSDSDDVSPKKAGYVAIPSPAPAKEVV